MQTWLATKDEETIFRSSTGANPSVADILKMVHPKPSNKTRDAFDLYMIGKTIDSSALPGLVTEFERFKAGKTVDVPDVPFTLLTSLPLSQKDWAMVALRASWRWFGMNPNTFARHGAFKEASVTERVSALLRDRAEIQRARVFPYLRNLMAAYRNCDESVPKEVRNSLQDAMRLPGERACCDGGRSMSARTFRVRCAAPLRDIVKAPARRFNVWI